MVDDSKFSIFIAAADRLILPWNKGGLYRRDNEEAQGVHE